MKYFYTDALAAAWMSKHFGMKSQYIEHYSDDSYEIKKLYIHLDSLHLLDMQIGDIVLKTSGISAICNEGWRCVNGKLSTCMIGDKIIQRNGKAFMMPESEEEC